jgi:hypothetical protein
MQEPPSMDHFQVAQGDLPSTYVEAVKKLDEEAGVLDSERTHPEPGPLRLWSNRPCSKTAYEPIRRFRVDI